MKDFIRVNSIAFQNWRLLTALLVSIAISIMMITGMIQVTGSIGWLALHLKFPPIIIMDLFPFVLYGFLYFVSGERYTEDLKAGYKFDKDRSIDKIAHALRKIEEGTYDATVSSTGEVKVDDAIYQISTKLAKESSREIKRNWVNEGLAKFREILSTHTEIHPLCDDIMSKLVHYVEASQGAIYVINDSEADPKLDMISCYAYGRNKFANQSFALGEGLVGQCFIEGKSIFISDVPADYNQIYSGLGKSTPRCVLIVPLKLKTEIIGILELALFKELETYQIEFLERFSESVAQSITTIRVNEHTRLLLDESIAREQKMMEQEEQMRESMEELYVTQEEMGKVNLEMEEVFNALDTLASTFELNPAGEIIKMNQNFADFLGYAPTELLYKRFIYLLDRSIHNENEINSFWTGLLNGQPKEVVFTHFDKEGTHKWLRSGFYPIRNTNGEIDRILGFSNDITELKNKEISLDELNHTIESTKVMLIKILNEIPLKVFLKQYNGKFFVANDAVSKFHDLDSAEKLIGLSDFDFYDHKDASEWLKAEHEIIASGRREYLNEDGGKVLSTVKMPFYIDPIGEKGLLGIQADITEIVNLRRKVNELQKDIDDMKRGKNP